MRKCGGTFKVARCQETSAARFRLNPKPILAFWGSMQGIRAEKLDGRDLFSASDGV